LVAFCLRHFLADFIICMCVFDFRQGHAGLNANLIALPCLVLTFTALQRDRTFRRAQRARGDN
jgi:hypothetical protein